MRRWGILITGLYAAILIGVLMPMILMVSDIDRTWSLVTQSVLQSFSEWSFWFYVAILVGSQATLLFLSVDTSRQRLKPRTHILISGAVTTLLTALLSLCVVYSLSVTIQRAHFLERMLDNNLYLLCFCAALWAGWGVIFYLYLRNKSVPLTRLTSWLLKGSVLELLVAVPCHVIVRRRGDCCAPAITGFGIATGLAIMLLSFGPGVLLLYKKRLDAYADRSTSAGSSAKARAAANGE